MSVSYVIANPAPNGLVQSRGAQPFRYCRPQCVYLWITAPSNS